MMQPRRLRTGVALGAHEEFVLELGLNRCRPGFLRHEDGRSTVVPAHSGETIGPGLLHKTLRDWQLTADQLGEPLYDRSW
jgi:hypothetical protein